MMMDKHTLALVSIIGSSLDVLGALYLAYDLLGGEHGPLRTLTRAVTYGALFGTGYGLALGPVFGLASGLAHGITLAWEFSRASRHEPKPGFWLDTAMSGTRAGRGHGDRRLLHTFRRMGGRSCARKTHGGLWRWPDSDRLHSSIRSVLAWAARCGRSIVDCRGR